MDNKSATEDRPQGTQVVLLESLGYAWECPHCGTGNEECEALGIITCGNAACGVSFFSKLPLENK